VRSPLVIQCLCRARRSNNQGRSAETFWFRYYLFERAEPMEFMGIVQTPTRAITMTFLSIIATLYAIVGITSLAYFKKFKLGTHEWQVPVPCVHWDKHGFLYVCVGIVYGGADYLIHIGVLAH
jgi:hypothetical protein